MCRKKHLPVSATSLATKFQSCLTVRAMPFRWQRRSVMCRSERNCSISIRADGSQLVLISGTLLKHSRWVREHSSRFPENRKHEFTGGDKAQMTGIPRGLLLSGLIAGSLTAAHAQQATHHWAIVIHGGAGVIERSALGPKAEANYRASLEQAIGTGAKVLEQGGSSLDAERYSQPKAGTNWIRRSWMAPR